MQNLGDNITSLGMDCSITFGKLVFQSELTYSPNKAGLKKQKWNKIDEIKFPYEIKKSSHMALSTGFNYYVPIEKVFKNHKGETVFTFEFYHSDYFDKEITNPLINELILLRLQDTYFQNRLKLSLTSMIDIANDGNLIWPKMEYVFSDKIKAEFGFVSFSGNFDKSNETGSLFYYLRDNDFLSLKVRYEF